MLTPRHLLVENGAVLTILPTVAWARPNFVTVVDGRRRATFVYLDEDQVVDEATARTLVDAGLATIDSTAGAETSSPGCELLPPFSRPDLDQLANRLPRHRARGLSICSGDSRAALQLLELGLDLDFVEADEPAARALLTAVAKSDFGLPLVLAGDFTGITFPGRYEFAVAGRSLPARLPSTGSMVRHLRRMTGSLRPGGAYFVPARRHAVPQPVERQRWQQGAGEFRSEVDRVARMIHFDPVEQVLVRDVVLSVDGATVAEFVEAELLMTVASWRAACLRAGTGLRIDDADPQVASADISWIRLVRPASEHGQENPALGPRPTIPAE